jgi:uncharacterized protein YciI
MKLLGFVILAGIVFGAPEPTYEMTTYTVGIVRKGPNWTAADTPETRRIQAGHMANIQKMATTGKLIVAGPMGEGDDLRGVFIFKDTTPDEARAMMAVDPAVQAGRFIPEVHAWYAAAGLKVNPPK